MTRRSREELRALMIGAGCELLAQRGLAFDPPNLTYANVFSHLEHTRGIRLHRSQVHGRIWNSQDHYRIAVVARAIADTARGSAEVDELVRDLRSPKQSVRIRTFAEAWITASSDASRDQATLDLRYELLIAAQALSTSGTETPSEIACAAKDHLEERNEHNEHRYRHWAETLGASASEEFGLEPDHVWSILARSSTSLVEGARLIESIDDVLSTPFHVTDNENNPQTRDAATYGLCLIIEQLFGLDNDDTN